MFTSNVIFWYDQSCYITIWIKSENNKNIPYVVILDVNGKEVSTIKFGDNDISVYRNTYIFINQKTGTIVANINSQIKIWRLVE